MWNGCRRTNRILKVTKFVWFRIEGLVSIAITSVSNWFKNTLYKQDLRLSKANQWLFCWCLSIVFFSSPSFQCGKNSFIFSVINCIYLNGQMNLLILVFFCSFFINMCLVEGKFLGLQWKRQKKSNSKNRFIEWDFGVLFSKLYMNTT